MIMLGAEVWTYWLAPPLLVASLLLTVATAVGYYTKVAVPAYRAEQHRRLEMMRAAGESGPEAGRLAESTTNTSQRMPLAA